MYTASLAQPDICTAFYPMSHGVLDGWPRRRISEPTEIASREGIVTRAFDANIETDLEPYGSRARKILLEPQEELAQCALAAEQQRMGVPRLRRSRSMQGLRGQSIALQNNDVIKVIGERACGREPSHSGADHDGPFADLN
jgi:hypothetical protein